MLLDLLSLPAEEREHVVRLWDWIAAGSFSVDVAFLVDPLSITMVLVVTGVGALIHVYADRLHGATIRASARSSPT